MDSLPEHAGGGPAAVLSRFRRAFHLSCLAPAGIFGLVGAVLCAGGPVRHLAP
jgi:hypothetical protein